MCISPAALAVLARTPQVVAQEAAQGPSALRRRRTSSQSGSAASGGPSRQLSAEDSAELAALVAGRLEDADAVDRTVAWLQRCSGGGGSSARSGHGAREPAAEATAAPQEEQEEEEGLREVLLPLVIGLRRMGRLDAVMRELKQANASRLKDLLRCTLRPLVSPPPGRAAAHSLLSRDLPSFVPISSSPGCACCTAFGAASAARLCSIPCLVPPVRASLPLPLPPSPPTHTHTHMPPQQSPPHHNHHPTCTPCSQVVEGCLGLLDPESAPGDSSHLLASHRSASPRRRDEPDASAALAARLARLPGQDFCWVLEAVALASKAYLDHCAAVGEAVEAILTAARAPKPQLAAAAQEARECCQAAAEAAAGRWSKLLAGRARSSGEGGAGGGVIR